MVQIHTSITLWILAFPNHIKDLSNKQIDFSQTVGIIFREITLVFFSFLPVHFRNGDLIYLLGTGTWHTTTHPYRRLLMRHKIHWGCTDLELRLCEDILLSHYATCWPHAKLLVWSSGWSFVYIRIDSKMKPGGKNLDLFIVSWIFTGNHRWFASEHIQIPN